MECFVYGKWSANLRYLSEMKKTDFEKEFKNVIDVKSAWVELQVVLKGYKKENKKK